MIAVIIKFTKDEEMIEAHCTADEVRKLNPEYKIRVVDKDGKEDEFF